MENPTGIIFCWSDISKWIIHAEYHSSINRYCTERSKGIKYLNVTVGRIVSGGVCVLDKYIGHGILAYPPPRSHQSIAKEQSFSANSTFHSYMTCYKAAKISICLAYIMTVECNPGDCSTEDVFRVEMLILCAHCWNAVTVKVKAIFFWPLQSMVVDFVLLVSLSVTCLPCIWAVHCEVVCTCLDSSTVLCSLFTPTGQSSTFTAVLAFLLHVYLCRYTYM